MIPIKDMQFAQSIAGNGDTVVRGKLEFNSEWRISRYELSACNFDSVEYTKEKMRLEVWRAAYGDISSPLRELEVFALRNATHDIQEVRALVDKIRALIEFPTSGVRPQVAWKATE